MSVNAVRPAAHEQGPAGRLHVALEAPRPHRLPAPLAAVLALLAYGAITLALFPSVVAHLASAFPGDLGDPPSQAWILAWDVHALATHPLHLYNANIFYPFRDVLAYQDSLLGLLPLAAPVLWLSGSPVVAYNVLFLLSFALCAWGAYALARLLVGDGRAAFLAGLVYGFSPYRMVHLYHLNLLSGMWIPFALLCWEQVRRGRQRYWVGVGLFFVLQALSALYYAAFLAVALAVLLALHLRQSLRLDPEGPGLQGEPAPEGAWQGTGPEGPGAVQSRRLRDVLSGADRSVKIGRNASVGRRRMLAGAAATALCSAVALLPFFLPYFRVEHALGASRGLGQAVYFAADLRDFLHVTDLSVLYGWSGHVLGVRSTDALQYLWPGALVLGLALCGLVGARRVHGRLPVAQRAYTILGLVTAVLCLGPFLKVWGVQTGLPLPFLLLYPVPGFAGLRDPARFGAIYSLCLGVLAAYGAAVLLRGQLRVVPGRVRRLRGGATLVALALCAGVLAESWIQPLPAVAVGTGASVPPVYRWLAAQQPGQPVLELPIGLDNKVVWAQQAQMMYYSTVHWQPIVNGTGGFAPPGYTHDAPIYESFPAPAALRLLRARRVRYVVVHRDWIGARAADAIRARAVRTRGVTLLKRWPDADLYALL